MTKRISKAIEYAFEHITRILNSNYNHHTKEEIKKDQIKGLEAVLQVILKFDECNVHTNKVFTSKDELINI